MSTNNFYTMINKVITISYLIIRYTVDIYKSFDIIYTDLLKFIP